MELCARVPSPFRFTPSACRVSDFPGPAQFRLAYFFLRLAKTPSKFCRRWWSVAFYLAIALLPPEVPWSKRQSTRRSK
jgi:hypothetical protein